MAVRADRPLSATPEEGQMGFEVVWKEFTGRRRSGAFGVQGSMPMDGRYNGPLIT